MRKRMLWASILAGMLSACTVYAQGFSYMIQQDVLETVEYAVYEDAEGKTPFQTDQKPLILKTDEYGTAVLETDEDELYIRRITDIDGYYSDDTVHRLEDLMFMFMDPINVSFASDTYPVTFQIKDEDENVIAKWQANAESKAALDGEDVIFQAGKKYSLTDLDQDENCLSDPVVFEIPRMKKEETVKITYVHLTYGTFKIHVKDEDNSNVKDARYQLFDDEACTKASIDIDEKEAVLQTDEQGLASGKLLKGTYYLKQLDVDKSYYRNGEIQKIEVKEEKTTELEEICKKIQAKVILLDAKENKEIAGKVHFQSDEEGFDADSSQTITLKRGISYQIKDVSHPLGYYPCEMMEYVSAETEPQENVIKVNYVPYAAHFSITDADTNAFVNGGNYQILDTNQKEVLSFSLEENEFVTSSLQEGNTYILHQSVVQEGFTSIPDTSFSIPSSYTSPQDSVIEVNAKTTPYVYVHTSIIDSEKRKINDGIISLYTDLSCTNPAKDLDGNEISALYTDQDLTLKTGTYYAKISNLSGQYYLPQDVIRYEFTHTDGIQKKIVFQPKQVRANIQVVDSLQQPLSGVKIDVLNADQEVIHSFTSQEDNTEELSNVLERGEEYYLRIAEMEGSYTYESEDIKVSIPLVQPDEELTNTIVCTPYVSLKVSQQDHFGNTIALYEDEKCTVLAKDISGAYTKKTMQDGTISWQLRDGTYYLKETEASENCYLSGEVKKVVLDSSSSFSEQITHQASVVSLQISIKDENGKALSGAKYEIQDRNGKTITTISDFQQLVTGDWLQPNETYIIHEAEAPKGYQSNQMDIVYTVPKTQPNEIPSVEISYGKNTKPKAVLNTSAKNEAEKDESLDMKWIFIPAGVIIITAGIVIFKRKRDIAPEF